MAVGDLITGDGQVEFRGVLFGAGTEFLIDGDGLNGLGVAELRSSESARPQAHGVFLQRTYLAERVFDFTLNVVGDTQAAVLANLQTLGGAFAPSSSFSAEALAFSMGGQTFIVYGRPDRTAINTEFLQSGLATASVRFLATDPRIYDASQQSDTATGASVSGGHGYPHAYPHGYGVVEAGTIEVVLGGNFAAFGIATIYGPCVSPKVERVETGEFVEVDITLLTDDVLVIDFQERTATLNGTVSYSGSVVYPDSTWFELPSGTSTIKFSRSSGTGSLTFAWRDSWLF